jgi:DNA polymerase-3 subunit delta
VVVVHGADPQRLDDALAAATRGAFPDPALIPFGREAFDGSEVDGDTIVRSALTMPLMTAERLVVVRHAQDLAEPARQAVAAYARDPNPTTCLLLLADTALDAAFVASLGAAVVVPLSPGKDRTLASWLRQRAADEGIRVTEEAARMLVEWVGEDTALLLGEVRKAALAGRGAQREVGRAEVETVVGRHRVAEAFELSRAIERGDRAAALQLLDRLLATEEAMRLLALLTGTLRLLWTIQEGRRRGDAVDQIARAARRPPFVVEQLAGMAARTSPETLARRLRRCRDVEHRLKSGGEERAEMTALVAELCDGR